MKLKLLAASVTAALSVSAQAFTITLDPFTLFQQQTITSGNSGSSQLIGGISSYIDERTLSLTAAAPLGVNPNITIGNIPGFGPALTFSVANNGTTTGEVTWTFSALLNSILASAQNWEITLNQVAINLGDPSNTGTTTAFSNAIAAGQLRSTPDNGTTILLANSTLNPGATSAFARFVMPANTDLVLNNLILTYTCASGSTGTDGVCTRAVPVPATLPILGLGLLGIAALRRKA